MTNNVFYRNHSRKVSFQKQLIFLVLALILRRTTPWPFRSNKAPNIVWEEDDEHEADSFSQDDAQFKSRKRRDLVWLFGPPRNKAKGKPSEYKDSNNQQLPASHPLRTDQWELKVDWRNSTLHSPPNLYIDFAENGYLRATSAKSSRQFSIGQWQLTPTGLTCQLNSTLLFHADLHLNAFGSQPRLRRGVVIDTASRGWKGRRLIVGTFTGHGVGQDTADLSYRKRRK